MVVRRSLVLILALLALPLGVSACGGGGSTRVAAGGDPSGSSTTAPAAAATSTTTAAETSTTTAAETSTTTAAAETSTTTVAAEPAGPSDASPVAGLRADQLQAAIEAPVAATTRRIGGPTVDQVTLPDGTRVWRVRIPGTFTARSARIAISVGERRVGLGVVAPDLQAVTAVTTDGTGLVAGRAVSYQWEGSPSVAAGTLAVAR